MIRGVILGWIAALGVLGLLSAPSAAPPEPMAGTFTGNAREPLDLQPVSALGVFDPALAETPPGERVWMSYSAVDPSPLWPRLTARAVSTRIAFSDDRGVRWTDVGAVNPVHEVERGSERRTWQNEVSSLLFDPFAPPEERWKLFWHHYPASGEDRQFQHGWIAYKRAPSPAGLGEAVEIKLFGGTAYDAVNDTSAGRTGSPVAGPPAIAAAALGEAAEDCITFSEPDVMARQDGLYVAIGCYAFHPRRRPPVEGRIMLLRCGAPCRPETPGAWRVVDTLLAAGDARPFGGTYFSAADLFSHAGRHYLVVTPVGNRPAPDFYRGCVVFRFADLAAGRLERNGDAPAPMKTIGGAPDSFNGACTFASGADAAGMLFGEVEIRERMVFRIYRSGAGF
jgi:hypothetical protein